MSYQEFKQLFETAKGPQKDMFKQFYQEEMAKFPDEMDEMFILQQEMVELKKLKEKLAKLQAQYEENPNDKRKRERVLLEKLIRIQAIHPEIALLGREIANLRISVENKA